MDGSITQLQWKSFIDMLVNDLPFISLGDWQKAAISDGLFWSLCTSQTKLQSQTRALLSKRRRVMGPTLWKASAGRWCSRLLCKKSLSNDGKSLNVPFLISFRWLKCRYNCSKFGRPENAPGEIRSKRFLYR